MPAHGCKIPEFLQEFLSLQLNGKGGLDWSRKPWAHSKLYPMLGLPCTYETRRLPFDLGLTGKGMIRC